MMRFHINRRGMIASILVIIVIAGLFIFFPRAQRNDSSNTPTPQTGKNAPTPTSPEKAKPAQTNSSVAAQPLTRACKLFTPQLAIQILGKDAVVSASDSVTVSETADMQVSSCVYTTTNHETVHFTAYLAASPLGQSANAVEFGSGRPVGVQDIPGQGQAAYWNESDHTLSVLKNNNRYIFSRSNNSQDSMLAAASVIVPKL